MAQAAEQFQALPFARPFIFLQPGTRTVVEHARLVTLRPAWVLKVIVVGLGMLADRIGLVFQCQPHFALVLVHAEFVRLQVGRQHDVMGERAQVGEP